MPDIECLIFFDDYSTDGWRGEVWEDNCQHKLLFSHTSSNFSDVTQAVGEFLITYGRAE